MAYHAGQHQPQLWIGVRFKVVPIVEIGSLIIESLATSLKAMF